MNQQRRYLSYLLRLWQESAGDPPGGDPPLWRASLESPRSGEPQGFAGLDELFNYLRQRTGMASPADSIQKYERTAEADSQAQED